MDIFPPLPMLLAFLAASFILAVTPGPAVLYIITRSIAQGKSSGLASVAGVALGNMGNMIGASIGLAALFLILNSLAKNQINTVRELDRVEYRGLAG